MSLKNIAKGTTYPFSVSKTENIISRLVGLLGTEKPDFKKALHIVPCSGIHTFGMQYPVDLLFLDKKNCIIQIYPNFPPNHITKIIPSAKSVLEVPPGSVEKYQISVGDCLEITTYTQFKTNINALKNLFHWPVNISIALLWSRFVYNAMNNWLSHNGPIQLGIVIHNTLLMGLFLTRRKSTETSYRILDWLIPIMTIMCAMLLKPKLTVNHQLYIISMIIQCLGILGIIISLLSLGRSFGIIPANRKIKSMGAYGVVRHPLYTSELIFHFGFLLGNRIIWNGVIIMFIVAGQLWRSHSEEKLLSKDNAYQDYIRTVHYRFIPGIY